MATSTPARCYGRARTCFIDFEGEPGRPLSERRHQRSALTDVAGMLRSFHYAAFGTLLNPHVGGAVRLEDIPRLEPWAAALVCRWRATFVDAYLEASASRSCRAKPRSHRRCSSWRCSRRCCTSSTYELNNRPDWVSIPLRGLLELFGADVTAPIAVPSRWRVRIRRAAQDERWRTARARDATGGRSSAVLDSQPEAPGLIPLRRRGCRGRHHARPQVPASQLDANAGFTVYVPAVAIAAWYRGLLGGILATVALGAGRHGALHAPALLVAANPTARCCLASSRHGACRTCRTACGASATAPGFESAERRAPSRRAVA